jgi:hypothetical protein
MIINSTCREIAMDSHIAQFPFQYGLIRQNAGIGARE